jgi:Trk K+ transport system NAD-binding subunit
MKDHVIVVGHGHLGGHLVDHLRQSARPYVLIERDSTVVDDLVRAGEPVVVDDARQESTLLDAGVERANLVVITANNIETALLVTKRVRDRNKKATVVVRCYLDEFTEILESLGANEVISSSKSAFNEIAARISALGAAR